MNNYSIDWRDKHSAQYRVQMSAKLLPIRVCGKPDEAERVARLIASAPDLLAALTAMMREFGEYDETDTYAVVLARAAIAKATEVQS